MIHSLGLERGLLPLQRRVVPVQQHVAQDAPRPRLLEPVVQLGPLHLAPVLDLAHDGHCRAELASAHRDGREERGEHRGHFGGGARGLHLREDLHDQGDEHVEHDEGGEEDEDRRVDRAEHRLEPRHLVRISVRVRVRVRVRDKVGQGLGLLRLGLGLGSSPPRHLLKGFTTFTCRGVRVRVRLRLRLRVRVMEAYQ